METKLAKKAMRGSKTAFGQLIESMKVDAYRLAYHYVGNEADATDAVCAAIEKAYVKISGLNDAQKVKSWFLSIVANEAKMIIRKESKIIYMESYVDHLEESNPSFEEKLIDAVDLQSAVEQLSDEEQEVVHLKFYQQMTFKEISGMLDVSENTIKTRYYAMLRKLRGLMDKEVRDVR